MSLIKQVTDILGKGPPAVGHNIGMNARLHSDMMFRIAQLNECVLMLTRAVEELQPKEEKNV